MAPTNSERVQTALELLKKGLAPFIEREVKRAVKDGLATSVITNGVEPYLVKRTIKEWDVSALMNLMESTWNEIFREVLGRSERSLVVEIRGFRNKWAHQERFSGDDTYRLLDSTARLLTSVSAPEADSVEQMKRELLRLRFEEQTRVVKRKETGTLIDTVGSVNPWREVIFPHQDVQSGRYQQAEFAADLWQVHIGQGADEYRDPIEFFSRTYLTESLKRLLIRSIRRLSANGGDPVVQLQTNFGGGKTHSMLALYHLFSGAKTDSLPGIDELIRDVGEEIPANVRRVVLVGTKISPGNPSIKPDGTEVRTLWGELAWQLGGIEAFERVSQDDRLATNPGDVLREIFKEYGPCLILIDEWVAYARQLHDDVDLPAGTFETQFTFAQALTESAKLVDNCLLLISLPASDTSGSSTSEVDDVEVGGERGREALIRLRNVIGRVESSWQPASAQEGFEIVRRRLFEPIVTPDQFKNRDVVARTFREFYESSTNEFPSETLEREYEERIKSAYPIHPEVFERLYTDWSTLVKFQRTRGVLRLMAAVIHNLWENNDRNPLIMPANIAIDDSDVRDELTRYLDDGWSPVIESDVDGSNSLPVRIDRDRSNLGRYSAARRVARTIYLGSAPRSGASNQGIDERRIKLGCVLPGESPAIFSDALKHLAMRATYLYTDEIGRFWYSTQPTVTKLAEDRALNISNDRIMEELENRVRKSLTNDKGDFSRIHSFPKSSGDVPDDFDARLVVLNQHQIYFREGDSPAVIAANSILKSRGASPRKYQNTLVFLAPDQTRIKDLEDAIRRYKAWESIVRDSDSLDLSRSQVNQADAQLLEADQSVDTRVSETYIWLLVPHQKIKEDGGTVSDPTALLDIRADRLSSRAPLAQRASKKLRESDDLLLRLQHRSLQIELDNVPLWRGDHIELSQLADDFARYPYLPRLQDSSVLVESVRSGVSSMTWDMESFAFADEYDEKEKRYIGLVVGRVIGIVDITSGGMIVKADVASKQINAEKTPPADEKKPDGPSGKPVDPDSGRSSPKRFHGSVELNPQRVGRDAGKIAEEVVAHLVALERANVKVTLEIEADVEGGAPDQVVRIIIENTRQLNFDQSSFEQE